MKKTWKTLSSKVVYKNPWFRIRHDKVVRPDGKKGTYDVVETSGASVFIVALNRRGEVLLVRLHRYPLGTDSLEIPGGNSDGEGLLKAAKRELLEETGYRARSWKKCGFWHPMNGVSNELAYVFIARDLIYAGNEKQEEEGISGAFFLPVSKVQKLIRKGKITDGQTLAAIYFAFCASKRSGGSFTAEARPKNFRN